MNLQYIRIYTLTYFQPVFVDISRDSLGIHNLYISTVFKIFIYLTQYQTHLWLIVSIKMIYNQDLKERHKNFEESKEVMRKSAYSLFHFQSRLT